MRVALIHINFRLKGGMESYLRDLILGFSAADAALTLCVNKADPSLLRALPALTVRRFPWHFLSHTFKKFAFYLSCDRANFTQDHNLVISLAKVGRTDVLICGGVHKSYLLTKKSYRYLNNYLELYFERKAFEAAPVIIAHSQRIKNEILTHYKIDADKIKLLYPPISKRQFSYKTSLDKQRLREKLGFNEKEYIVLFVSTNHARKGFYPLVEAFKRLKSNFRCLILGAKPAITLPDTMQWLGFVEQPQDYYTLADVTILPSFYEPFGITIVESLECGTPVIVSAELGVAELLEEKDGIVLSSVTPEAIQNALEAIEKGNYKPERNFIARKGLTIEQHINALRRFALRQ